MGPASEHPGDGEQRVRCLYCGANNFAGTATCWQCSRPLKPLREPGPGTPALEYPAPVAAFTPPGAAPGRGYAALSPAAANAQASSRLAPKAAAALGLLFPWIALPIGMVFLMLDDSRKTYLGWITIGWSIAGTVLNLMGAALLIVPLLSGLHALASGGLMHGAAPGGGSSGVGGDDGLNLMAPIRLFFAL